MPWAHGVLLEFAQHKLGQREQGASEPSPQILVPLLPRSRIRWGSRCDKCGSRRRWIAAITECDVISRILSHLGLECEPVVPMPARPPPQAEFVYA